MKTLTNKPKHNAALRQRLRDILSGAAGYDTTTYIGDDDLIALKTSLSTLERFVVVAAKVLGVKTLFLHEASLNTLAPPVAPEDREAA